MLNVVTPLAGVWIEIVSGYGCERSDIVTPLAGVWIEITSMEISLTAALVTPLAGVWIEIVLHMHVPERAYVTPLAGVWIEIKRRMTGENIIQSLPLRECGLKLNLSTNSFCPSSHSPCGSVD